MDSYLKTFIEFTNDFTLAQALLVIYLLHVLYKLGILQKLPIIKPLIKKYGNGKIENKDGSINKEALLNELKEEVRKANNPHVTNATCELIRSQMNEKFEIVGHVQSKHGNRLTNIETSLSEIRSDLKDVGQMRNDLRNALRFNESLYYFLKNKYPKDVEEITRFK